MSYHIYCPYHGLMSEDSFSGAAFEEVRNLIRASPYLVAAENISNESLSIRGLFVGENLIRFIMRHVSCVSYLNLFDSDNWKVIEGIKAEVVDVYMINEIIFDEMCDKLESSANALQNAVDYMRGNI